jgi:hypothetical protein
LSSSWIVRPTMEGSAPKRRRHNASESRTERRPATSKLAGEITVPSVARNPSMGNTCDVVRWMKATSVESPLCTVTDSLRRKPVRENDVARSIRSVTLPAVTRLTASRPLFSEYS